MVIGTERLQQWVVAETQEQIEVRKNKGYAVLAEVRLIYDALTQAGNGEISQDALQYAYFNEKTAAIEAATNDIISITYQNWDPVFSETTAFGKSVSEMNKRGLQSVIALNEENGGIYSFEVERRNIELADSIITNLKIKDGTLTTHYKIVISPYPQEADADIAKSLGYHYQGETAKVRLYDFDDSAVKAYQIELCGHEIIHFIETIRSLSGDSSYSASHSSEILATQLYIPKDSLSRGIVDIARIYDQVLEKATGNAHYLGRVDRSGNYDDLFGKTRIVEEEIEPLLHALLETDIELAKSLLQGIPTGKIREKIDYFVNAKIERLEDGYLLDRDKRSRLSSAIVGTNGQFTQEHAEIIKSAELVRTWSIIACLVNPKKAEKIFGKEQVARVRWLHEADANKILANPFMMDAMIAKSDVSEITIACGGSVQNLFNHSLNQARNALFGDDNETSSLIERKVKCPECGWEPTAEQLTAMREGKSGAPTKCPHCGWDPCTKSKHA